MPSRTCASDGRVPVPASPRRPGSPAAGDVDSDARRARRSRSTGRGRRHPGGARSRSPRCPTRCARARGEEAVEIDFVVPHREQGGAAEIGAGAGVGTSAGPEQPPEPQPGVPGATRGGRCPAERSRPGAAAARTLWRWNDADRRPRWVMLAPMARRPHRCPRLSPRFDPGRRDSSAGGPVVDLRRAGDRNPGYWNAKELLGRRPARCRSSSATSPKRRSRRRLGRVLGRTWWVGYVGGAAAMIGHAWPVFAGFRGGRSVLCFAGAMLRARPRSRRRSRSPRVRLVTSGDPALRHSAHASGCSASHSCRPVFEPRAHVAATGALMSSSGCGSRWLPWPTAASRQAPRDHGRGRDEG